MAVEIDKDIADTVAHLKGVRAELKVERDVIYGKARALFAEHDHPGGARIGKSSGNVDAYVNLDDAGGAAGAIEFGHTTSSGKPVEGLHVLRRAMGG